jgi:hypothetical protein
LSIILAAAAHDTNVHEPTSSRLAPDMEGVDGVSGGDVKPRLFEECARAEGWAGGQERLEIKSMEKAP